MRAELEAHVVQPIEAVLLGLQKDTVLWHRGFLSVPKVIILARGCISRGFLQCGKKFARCADNHRGPGGDAPTHRLHVRHGAGRGAGAQIILNPCEDRSILICQPHCASVACIPANLNNGASSHVTIFRQ